MAAFNLRSRIATLWQAARRLVFARQGEPHPDEQSGGADHPFDRRHGMDTGGLLYAEALATGHAHDAENAGYYATAPSLFHGLIRRWRRTLPPGLRLRDFAFLDLGCGKGRVLMLATGYPFRSIAGIEANPALAAAARRNLARWPGARLRWRRPAAVTVIEADVLALELPEAPVVLFCFNAFESRLMQALLERLAELASMRTQPIDLLYVHPDFDAIARQTPGIEALFDEEIAFSAEDAAADVFKVAFDRCCGYRWGAPGA